MSKKRTYTSLVLGVALATAGLSNASPAPTLSMPLEPGSGFKSVGEVVHSDGTVTDTWRRGGSSVSVSGPTGTGVRIFENQRGAGKRMTRTLGVAATMPEVDKSDSRAVDAMLASYAANRRSVVQTAIRSGMEPKAARAQFGHFDSGQDQPTVPKGLPKTGTRLSGAPKLTLSPSLNVSRKLSGLNNKYVQFAPDEGGGGGTYYNSVCATVKSDDGNLKTTGCEVQKIDQRNGADWWLADEFQASGVSTDTCWNCWYPARLHQIYIDIQYGSGNQIVKWSPSVTRNEPDSCRTETFSVASPKTGIGYSVSQRVCSETVGPHVLSNQQGARFGTVWNGHEPEANWWEGTHGVDVTHSPASASAAVCMAVSMTWGA